MSSMSGHSADEVLHKFRRLRGVLLLVERLSVELGQPFVDDFAAAFVARGAFGPPACSKTGTEKNGEEHQ